MSNYTIVEPSFELWQPCTPENYMPFVERATRTCYKSEEHIKEGSAEKLMNKVVNKFGHHSVIEHATAILEIGFDSSQDLADFTFQVLETVPLFALRMSPRSGFTLIISGNLRMWRRLLRMAPEPRKMVFPYNAIRFTLGQNYPFFFEAHAGFSNSAVRLIDPNPSTNHSFLSRPEMMKHMTLTGKFIGSRTMSHQLVRHRLAAYSQESQRYCNYGTKGFQFIIPPSIPEDYDSPRCLTSPRESFIQSCTNDYMKYKIFLERGIPPEDARAVLPNATKTEVVATYTLEIWKHVIGHRGHNPKAQWEIRDLCLSAEQQINKLLGWEICG